MKIEYEYFFGLPRDMVWKYLKNEKVLKNALPGCKSLIETTKGVYHAKILMTIGPIQDLFNVEIHLDEEKAPSFFKLNINGNGNVGAINGQADFSLKDNQGACQLTCKAKAQVTGAMTLAGKHLLDSGVSKGLDNFFQKVEREIKRSIYQIKKKHREQR